MFGLDTVSWKSFLIFALILCAVIDIAIICAIKLKGGERKSRTSEERKKKSEFYASDGVDDIEIKRAFTEDDDEPTEAHTEEMEEVKKGEDVETKQVFSDEDEEGRNDVQTIGATDIEGYDEMFSEESIPCDYVPQTQQESIISNGMMTFDEILSIINNDPSSVGMESEESEEELSDEQTDSINKIFRQFAAEGESERMEEQLDEIQGMGNGEPEELTTTSGGKPEQTDNEDCFGENPYVI